LPVIPKSSAAFITVKVSAVVDHPDLKATLEQLQKTPEALDGFVEMLGVGPREIDRVTLFWPTVADWRWFGDPVLVVTTRGPYNEARVLKSLRAEPVFGHDWQRDRGGRGFDGPGAAIPATKVAEPPPIPPKEPPKDEDPCAATGAAVGEPLFYELRQSPFGLLFLIDDRTLAFLPHAFGEGTMHLALLAQLMQKKATGPLSEAIASAGTHTFAAGIHLSPMFRAFEREMPRDLMPYAALLAARTGVVTGNLDKSAKLTLTLSFDDAAAAKRAGPVLEEGLKTLAGKTATLAAEMKEQHDPQEKAFAPIVEAVAAGLKSATTKTDGIAVVAATNIEVGPAAGKAAAELLQSLATRKKYEGRTNNLKQIGLALHNYHDVNGRLPTNVYNAKGEAILSWRVHLLPYLEYDNLYKRMKLDEPWDGPTNKEFIEQMPKVYAIPGRDAPKGQTFLQAFVTPNPAKRGKGGGPFNPSWLVDGEKQGRTLAGIPDGTSWTIAVAEAREAVIWSKPDDLPFGEKLPLLGDAKADRFAVLMLDGSTRMLPAKIDQHILRALITAAGGEVVPDDFDGVRRRPPGGGQGPGIIKEPPPSLPGKGEGPGNERLQRIEQLRQELEAARAAAELRTAETKRLEALFAQGAAKREDLDESRAELAVALTRLSVIERLLKQSEEPTIRPPVQKK
jgi:uncharacterized protein DUF1559